ncbi:MAG: hypothetical protein PHR83_07965 [Paludibacter sp.]|nr:hypothetical protein [Paludibacter sp.]
MKQKRYIHPKTARQLKKDGFRAVQGFESLLINETGKVYNLQTAKYIKPTSGNYIRIEKECLSVPKLVLLTFKGEQYKSGQIVYIDGNKTNLSKENIKYSRLFTSEQNNKVNAADLLTALRCYFEVDKNFKIRDNFKTRLYLQHIIEKRGFFAKYKKIQHIEVYLTYLGKHIFEQKSIIDTANAHGLPVRDCLIIINSFTNTLISEILQDLKNGYLHELEYKPKQPTKTDELKQVNKYLTENGHNPVRLRKQSEKEILRDYEKFSNEFKNTKQEHGI